ncbi:TPA: type VI secretion system Vgr family protein [Enterobacter asburiae]|uniref:type VI secretion system Vgr family protein n=1 Tax=Enterobacter cloacae complex TaxID=354276 RepID=UPI000B5094F7|nr:MULTISPECIES: type VI secretion system Vgr family protein [Enterobacter cloacae complex]ASD60164.1 type IV secretion protein Rhs [Enterobacter cloacae complex sp. ECNIH7]POV41220.1 type VI secretion system tip protein VgrG [Enterobacter cloacae complex sp. ECNIH11]POV45315.1 type VI secretion system tip protein VgrG [Enterobacter cloacae complex sp. ECNIH16]HBM7608865.1 type VI secretion system tip protein VgrG [Enterobacter asburiae]HBM7633676.1 type VI secretion system tip protein VgrG [E
MSLTDTLKNTLSALTEGGLNRYRLDIPSCTASLDVEEFNGKEFMSELYYYEVIFTSSDQNISSAQLLTKPATLTMGTGPLMGLTGQKVVHGVVTHFKRISGSRDQAMYQIIIEPFLSLLRKQFRTHRFFVNKSVPEVVTEVLQEHGLKGWEYEFTLKADYPKREQINQYKESDLAFIERLLAEVGIFYFFTLQPDTQTEVVHFADKQSAWTFGKSLPLSSPSGMSDNAADSVWGVNVRQNVVERNVTASDYNHREAQNVLASVPADMTRGEGDGVTYGEVYHYLPRHLERGDKITPSAETGNFWARLEHERFLSGQTTISGCSNDALLSPAQVLTISERVVPPTLPSETDNGIIVTRTGYIASRKDALIVMWEGMPYYENRCWRPSAKKRPVVSGTLMARVTSAKDNDIYAWQDASGMYRVKFDADRDDKKQGMESMPVRFAKPYGGDKYGFHFPLIQGTEVAIAFHEGDPDRPYIAHALHDSRHVDHVTEANSTRNVVRTAGLNKLRMEDKRGEEHVKISTEYGGKTQLNLGHNVDASRELRGEGAELRTDRYVSIRGGAGVFITADKQPFAGDKMLSMQEAIAQLENALSIARSMSDAAETAQALPADIQSQVKLTDALKDLAQPGMVLNAPEGVSITSPQAVRIASGSASVGIMSQQNTDISALKRFTVAAGEAVSMLARKAGMKLFAAKGKVEIQAQDDALDAIAKKDVNVTSTDGGVEITAAKDVVLKNLDGSFIQLQGKNIILGCGGNILLKCANVQKMGPATVSSPPHEFPKGYGGVYALNDESGSIIPKTEYKVTTAEGKVFSGISDENGKTMPIYTSMPGKLNIEILGTGNSTAGSKKS